MKELSGVPLLGRLGWKGLSGTNAVAYFAIFVSDEEKKLNDIETTSMFNTFYHRNKLECLSLKAFL